MLMLLSSLLTAQASDLEINVADPAVTHVELACTGQKLRSRVEYGVARFSQVVKDCSVTFISVVGQIPTNDKYTCSSDGCTKNDIEYKNVPYDANRLVIVITDKSARMLELSCPSGYRARTEVDTNTAVFDGLPLGEDCTMYWKAGPPGVAKRLVPGRYFCKNQSGQGVCKPR